MPIWNIQLNKISQEGKLSPLIYIYTVDQLCKGQLAELPAILDSFYINITSD